LSPIRIIVWMPEPDCFVQYHTARLQNFAALPRLPASCAEFYVRKIPRIRFDGTPLEQDMVLKWFY